MSEFRKRIMVPVAVALSASAFIGILVFMFSRILLAVPEAGSTTLAFLLSALILFVAGILAATGSRMKPSQRGLISFGAVGILAMGVVGIALGIRDIEVHGAGFHLTAEGIAYDTETLTFPADEEVELEFTNVDEVPHDFDVFEDDSFTPPALVNTDTISASTITYTIPPLAEGTYAFQCSIHPTIMTGTLIVGGEGAEDDHGAEVPGEPAEPSEPGPTDEPIAAPPGEQLAAGPDVVIGTASVGSDWAFDTETIDIEADLPFSLVFTNADDGISHNVAIYAEEGGEQLFMGEIFSGVEIRTYEVEALAAGEYFFRCDVHPTQMTGTAIVS